MYKNETIKIARSLDGIDVGRISVMGSLSCQTSFHGTLFGNTFKCKVFVFIFILTKSKWNENCRMKILFDKYAAYCMSKNWKSVPITDFKQS